MNLVIMDEPIPTSSLKPNRSYLHKTADKNDSLAILGVRIVSGCK